MQIFGTYRRAQLDPTSCIEIQTSVDEERQIFASRIHSYAQCCASLLSKYNGDKNKMLIKRFFNMFEYLPET